MGPEEDDRRCGEITYLLAVYNQERYLDDCLQSLLDQTDLRWRALVFDDASTDSSLERLRAYGDERIRVIEGERNVGYIAALERLIEESETDLLAILDPDDSLHPEATAELLAVFEKSPEVGFAYSGMACFQNDWSTYLGPGPSRPIQPGGDALLENCVHAIRAFRRSVYRKTRGLDSRMLYAEDRDLIYKMEEVTRFAFVDRPLYRYRFVTSSQSQAPRKKEVGARNHFRAQFEALSRRRVRGRAKLAYWLRFFDLYINYTERWSPVRRWAGPSLHRLSRRTAQRWIRDRAVS